MTGWVSRALPAAAAGLALALTATSLTGVLAGVRWWSYVVLSIAAVVSTGVALRWLRLPAILTAAGQLAALLGLVTGVFTTSGWLLVVPGSASVAELAAVLARAAHQIRVSLPPVPETTEMVCLVVVCIGLVAVAVDAVAVSVAAPAITGLMLLCVLTVPAAVSTQMLPWWSFALGAAGFALLLALDSQRRLLAWGEPVGTGKDRRAAPAAVVVTTVAMVGALLIGTTVTAVGTSRASRTPDHTKVPITGIGLTPFTSLRGQLSTGEAVPLLRVRGLVQRTYLRALTLSRFTAGAGWQQGPLDPAIPADDARTERLPLPPGVATPVSGSTIQVQIESINYADYWLPSFGYPLSLGGISPDWRYDPTAITVFSQHRQRPEPYTELGVLPQADPQLLRAAGPGGGASFSAVDPRYLETGEVDQRVVQLAARLTAGTRTAFDATIALYRWFTQPTNGFSYDLRTAPGNSGDALVDFLFTGRRGYCEQFASAMAVMLRTLRVPARVAVGFTPGTVAGDSRLITTEDAHAWVEAWFPGAGWLPFDPTPLSRGRTVLPAYVVTAGAIPPSGPAPSATPAPAELAQPTPEARAAAPQQPPRVGASSGGPFGLTPAGLTLAGLLGLAALVGIAPMALRQGRRRRRMHLIGAGGPRAVRAAWEEVLAESADRGVVPGVGETVRVSAQRLVSEHGMDEPGQAGLRGLVEAVEQTWYAAGSTSAPPPDPGSAEIRSILDAVLTSMTRATPLSRTARLLPRSVLNRLRHR